MPPRKIKDGITDLNNQLANRRNVHNRNEITHRRLSYSTLRAIFNGGIGSQIVRLKSNVPLKDNLTIEQTELKFFNKKLKPYIYTASEYMIGFGRGIIVLIEKNKKLSDPISKTIDRNNYKLEVFDGSMVTVSEYSIDLMDDRYNKPIIYNIRGYDVHHSRVIDFTYHKPIDDELPFYNFGGISEFEKVYNQLINDAIVERSSGAILEKNSTVFYKVDGFKQLLQQKKEAELLRFFGALEDARSIYGAGILDKNDDVVSVSQQLTNLDSVDTISLRRLSMVTGIPLSVLVGENVKGLNATGENEMSIWKDMIETIQDRYLIHPINELLSKFGIKEVEFDRMESLSVGEQVEADSKIIANAKGLYDMGEDYEAYLKEYNITKKKDDTLSWLNNAE